MQKIRTLETSLHPTTDVKNVTTVEDFRCQIIIVPPLLGIWDD